MTVPCVKNHYGRTYVDEFMPTCLRGANCFETVNILINYESVGYVYVSSII